MMRWRWYGHACFHIEFEGGLTIVTDPFGPEVGYRTALPAAQLVTVSHEHFDHNCVQAVQGKPQVWRGGQASEQTRDIQGVRIREVNLAHDALGGQRRGPNTAFVFAVGALTAVHLGDLGHEMTDAQAESIGPCGVVFLPVGGHYTIGPEVAVQVVERLQPNIVVPMHYRTPAIADWPLVRVEEFLALIDAPVRRLGTEASTRAGSLPEEREVWVMEPVEG